MITSDTTASENIISVVLAIKTTGSGLDSRWEKFLAGNTKLSKIMGINSNMNGAGSQKIQLETSTEMIFNDVDDNEVLYSFAVKYITAATSNINKLAME